MPLPSTIPPNRRLLGTAAYRNVIWSCGAEEINRATITGDVFDKREIILRDGTMKDCELVNRTKLTVKSKGTIDNMSVIFGSELIIENPKAAVQNIYLFNGVLTLLNGATVKNILADAGSLVILRNGSKIENIYLNNKSVIKSYASSITSIALEAGARLLPRKGSIITNYGKTMDAYASQAKNVEWHNQLDTNCPAYTTLVASIKRAVAPQYAFSYSTMTVRP